MSYPYSHKVIFVRKNGHTPYTNGAQPEAQEPHIAHEGIPCGLLHIFEIKQNIQQKKK